MVAFAVKCSVAARPGRRLKPVGEAVATVVPVTGFVRAAAAALAALVVSGPKGAIQASSFGDLAGSGWRSTAEGGVGVAPGLALRRLLPTCFP